MRFGLSFSSLKMEIEKLIRTALDATTTALKMSPMDVVFVIVCLSIAFYTIGLGFRAISGILRFTEVSAIYLVKIGFLVSILVIIFPTTNYIKGTPFGAIANDTRLHDTLDFLRQRAELWWRRI